MTLLIVGGYSAALGWRPGGAVIMLSGFLGRVMGHLATGFIEYRRIMSRPWPKVAPLADDDD